MRDAEHQLSAAETVTVWLSGHRRPKWILTYAATLPIAAVIASFARHPGATWVVLAPTLLLTPIVIERMFRTELTPGEKMRVTEAQLTGRSTGDTRLDGWAAHHAAQAADRQSSRRGGSWRVVAIAAVVVVGVAVAAAVRSSPWWLLCLFPLPLYLAPGLAYAQSDPGLALELLHPDGTST